MSSSTAQIHALGATAPFSSASGSRNWPSKSLFFGTKPGYDSRDRVLSLPSCYLLLLSFNYVWEDYQGLRRSRPAANSPPKTGCKAPSYWLHPFHHSQLEPLHNSRNSKSVIMKASPASPFPVTPANQKPKRSYQNDVFPNSMLIHDKNPHAIYRDIQKFANQEKLKEALAILDYLGHRGIPTNVTTFLSLIAACMRLKAKDAAKQVHAHIRINGLEKNEILQTRLVHLYASFGSIEDAKGVFETMPVTSIYPWNALLRGNVMLGRGNQRQVLSSFMEMQASGVEMNVYSYSCLIKSLAGMHSLRQGLKTHGLMIKKGWIGSCILRTSLIDMYFKCGKIKLACSVFEEIDEKDVVVWGAMIAGFAHNRLQREALRYMRCMVGDGITTNSVILTTILPVIGEVGAQNIGREVHAYVIKRRKYLNLLFIQSALVDMYCKCGDIVSGRKVFYGFTHRNAISWTALISGYVANGRFEQALRSIIWMQQEGFRPDVVTIATVLPVCGQLRALKQGKEIHAYAVKNDFLPGVSIATSLMMMYSKCSALNYCIRLFHDMEQKNVISWTVMIECNIQGKCLNEALDVFRLMQLSKHRADSVTMARALSVCGQLKVQKLGKEIHGQAFKKGYISIPFVTAEIVRMYGNSGEINKAQLCFDIIPVKGSMTWTAIIEAYRCDCQYKKSIRLFNQMISDGFTPNQFTFEVVLRACVLGRFAGDALRIFALMTQKYSMKAAEEHYACVINLLTCLGRTQEAEKLIQLRSSVP